MLSWFISVFLVFLLLKVSHFYLNRKYDYWKKRGVPYIKPKPLVGSIMEVALGRAHPGLYIGRHYYKFDGPYFGFYAFAKPYLVLTDPELIKTLLIKDFNSFPNRYFVSDKNIDPIISNGLFAIKNPTWRWLRQKLSPFLSYGKIKLMLPLVKECGEYLKDYINDNVDKCVETKEMCAKYATDVIVSCTFGVSCNSFKNEGGFRLAGKTMLGQSFLRSLKIFSYYYAPLLVKIFRFKFIEKSAVDFMRNIFLNVLADRENSNTKNKRNDLVDVLIELKKQNAEFEGFKLDDAEHMVAQAVTFFSSGFEAAASTLAFTLHELAVNVEIQEKLRDEIKGIVTNSEDVSFNHVQGLKFLNMVVLESMRKYPATSFIHRECLEDYKVEATGLVIEKGTPVIVGQYGLHYDEKYFPEPQKYDPERFNDENKILNCTYLPFGDGPRSCVGQMLGLLLVKMAIIGILRNFLIERDLTTAEPVVLTNFPIIQSKGGIPLRFKHLSSSF